MVYAILAWETSRIASDYDVRGRMNKGVGNAYGVDACVLNNPFTYRGYYYDAETGFYYLESRYYDPNTGRFINADGQLNNGLLGKNMYAYCENNPVMYKQSPVFSGSSVTSSSISVGGSTSVGPSPGKTITGSFRNGLWFGSGSVTGLYADWNARVQISLRKGTFKIGVAGKFSLINTSGQVGFGTDDLNISLKAVGDVGTVSGMAGIFIDPRKNTYFIGVEAKATALSGRIGGQLDVFGLQSEVGLAGELGSIGGRFGIGVRSNAEGKTEFYFGSGFALGVGWDFYIRVRFDELFS